MTSCALTVMSKFVHQRRSKLLRNKQSYISDHYMRTQEISTALNRWWKHNSRSAHRCRAKETRSPSKSTYGRRRLKVCRVFLLNQLIYCWLINCCWHSVHKSFLLTKFTFNSIQFNLISLALFHLICFINFIWLILFHLFLSYFALFVFIYLFNFI